MSLLPSTLRSCAGGGAGDRARARVYSPSRQHHQDAAGALSEGHRTPAGRRAPNSPALLQRVCNDAASDRGPHCIQSGCCHHRLFPDGKLTSTLLGVWLVGCLGNFCRLLQAAVLKQLASSAEQEPQKFFASRGGREYPYVCKEQESLSLTFSSYTPKSHIWMKTKIRTHVAGMAAPADRAEACRLPTLRRVPTAPGPSHRGLLSRVLPACCRPERSLANPASSQPNFFQCRGMSF